MAPQRGSSRTELLETLLPWEVENKVIALFSIVKVPLILFVGIFGAIAESDVKQRTTRRWSRDVLHAAGPSCYVHQLGDDPRKAPEHREYSLVKWLNATVLPGKFRSRPQVTVADVKIELAGRDLCGFEEGCEPNEQVLSEGTSATGGVQRGASFALLWMFYKLIFIGIHPVDRLAKHLANRMCILKLLTEPYFQKPCTMPMAIMVKIFFYIRYKIMPNALLTALATLETHPACAGLMHYRMDWFWGAVTYYTIIVDLLITVLLYAVLFQANSQLVGSWSYRLYKLYWFGSSLFPAIFVFFDVLTTVQWNIFRLIRFGLRITFSFDLAFAFYIDLLQLFLAGVVFLEFTEFLFFVMQVLCPNVLQKNMPFLDHLECEGWSSVPDADQDGASGDDGDPLLRPVSDATGDDEPAPATSGPSKAALPSLRSGSSVKKALAKPFQAFAGALSSRTRPPASSSPREAAAAVAEPSRSPAALASPRMPCKRGCGRLAALGSYKGRPFETCCRSCATGRGHDAHCSPEAPSGAAGLAGPLE